MGTTAARPLTWETALRLGRVSNLPTVWTNAAAGIVLAEVDPVSLAGLGMMAALSALYIAGMYLNDAFDAEADRISRPGRPIPSGAASRAAVFGIGLGLMAAGVGAGTAIGLSHRTALHAFAAGSALAVAILTYDRWHKGNPLGPLLMGLCRALAYITAAAATVQSVPAAVLWAAITTVSYLVGLTYAAKQEDLRQPGSLWPLLFLAAPFVYGARVATHSGIGAFILLLLGAAVILACSWMVSGDRRSIPRAVATLIAGISLVDGLFIVGQGHVALAGLTIIAFALTLALQRVIAGT